MLVCNPGIAKVEVGHAKYFAQRAGGLRSDEARNQSSSLGDDLAQLNSENQSARKRNFLNYFARRARIFLVQLLVCVIFAGQAATVFAATWTSKQSMPAARYASAFAATNGKLYVFGGRFGESIFGDSYAYDPGANSWSVLASMPGPRGAGNGAGVINGKIYIAGGVSPGSPNFINNNLLEYDPVTNAWTSRANMPTPSAEGATEVINGKLYVVTSNDGSVFRNWLHVWDPSNNTWTQLASSPVAHVSPASGTINGKLYLVGGINTDQLDVYDPATNTWQTLAPMPTSRASMRAVVLNGKLYVIGGSAASGITNVVEVYDPATNTWSAETPMPTARFQLAMGSINGIAYVVGGLTSGSANSAVSVLEAMSVSAPPISPGVSLSPSGLAFGNQNTGATGNVQSVTLTNSGGAALSISNIGITGANAAEFAVPSTSCFSSLAAGASCVINVTFSPTSAGAKSASVSIATNASGSPHTVNLTGTGVTQVVTLTSLSVSGPSSVASGGSATLGATALFSNGTSQAVTPSWASSNTATATISAAGQITAGVVTTNTPVTFTASYTQGGVTRTATLTLTVNASTGLTLQSLSIQGTAVVQEGGTATFRAIAFFSDGTSTFVSPIWTSSNPAAASVASSGALTTGQVSVDTLVTLGASYTENGVTRTTTFALTVRDVASIVSYLTITGASSIQSQRITTLTATATYTDGSSKTVSPAWTSSNSSVATVSAAGVVTAAQITVDTTVLITATYSEGTVTRTALFSLVVGPVSCSATPAVAAGFSHTIALRNDCTTWSWGWSFLGQSGTGEIKTRSTPIEISELSAVSAVVAGAAHNLALKNDGTVSAWGHNGQGGLGDGSTADRPTPVRVTGITDARAVAAGLVHSLALKSDGTVWSWGSNAQGQLGDGATTPVRLTPAQVPGLSGVTAIAANKNYSQALKSDGTVLAWGDLGPGGTTSTPRQTSQLSGVRAVAAGWEHVVALKTDGTVWTWGRNTQGQLGDGTRQDRSVPAQITGISDVKSIGAGYNHSVAIRNDGTVWIWGGNVQGQHGNGTTDPQLTPQPVPGMNNAVSVAAGNDYTVILKADGSVLGAGYNLLGQLGDGSFFSSNRFAPVQDAEIIGFFDLAPDVVKNPVPTDQVPKFFMQSEKSGDEALTAFGSVSNLSLATRIRRNGGSFAAESTNYQMFVAIFVPSGKPGLTSAGTATVPVSANTFFFKSSAAIWRTYTGGALPVFLSGVADNQVDRNVLNILASTDLTGLSGAQFYVGYGTSDSEMQAAGRYRIVFQVP